MIKGSKTIFQIYCFFIFDLLFALSKIKWPYFSGLTYQLSFNVLLIHTALICISLWYFLIWDNAIHPTIFFFKSVLAIIAVWPFQIICVLSLLCLQQLCCEFGIRLNLYITSEKVNIVTMLWFQTLDHGISLC